MRMRTARRRVPSTSWSTLKRRLRKSTSLNECPPGMSHRNPLPRIRLLTLLHDFDAESFGGEGVADNDAVFAVPATYHIVSLAFRHTTIVRRRSTPDTSRIRPISTRMEKVYNFT